MSQNPPDNSTNINEPALELQDNEQQFAHIPLLQNSNDNNRNGLGVNNVQINIRANIVGQIIKIYNYSRIGLAVFIF